MTLPMTARATTPSATSSGPPTSRETYAAALALLRSRPLVVLTGDGELSEPPPPQAARIMAASRAAPVLCHRYNVFMKCSCVKYSMDRF